jgi:hypothetical protein
MGKLAKDLQAGDFTMPDRVIESVLQSDDKIIIAVVSSNVLNEPQVQQWNPDDFTPYMSAVCPHCGEQIQYTLMNGEEQ